MRPPTYIHFKLKFTQLKLIYYYSSKLIITIKLNDTRCNITENLDNIIIYLFVA